jgi:hypothetical protein
MTDLQTIQVLLSVIIVNYRTPQLVTECLETLLPEIDGIDARIMLVDNLSGDDSPEIIRAWLANNDVGGKVTFIQSNRNGGYAAGNNMGIRECSAKHYLLLNSDTLIRPGAIRIILDTAQKFPEAGIISPRIELPDGTGQESCFRFRTPFSELIDASQTYLVANLLSRYKPNLPIQTQIARPQWTTFACVLVKEDVFRQIGLLDEGYFMYAEDMEFCHRVREAGWDIVHNPDAKVAHTPASSSTIKEVIQKKKRIPKYLFESRARYYYQVYGWLGLTSANLLWWLGRLISKTRQLLGNSDKAANERQWLDIWTNWLNPLKPYTPQKK